MNVGIVTIPIIDNYGCLLQNYALQQAIKHLGFEPITLDIKGRQLYRRILSYGKNIVSRPQSLDSYKFPPREYNRPKSFQKFIDKHILTTSPLYKYDADLCNQYNLKAVVAGSDQIWRPGYSLFPKDMYLEFVPDEISKFSYAASFGVSSLDLTEEQNKTFVRLLSRMASISVRERDGVEICSSLGINNAVHVLDPTMLLDKEHYIKLCTSTTSEFKSKIGVYFLDDNLSKQQIVKEVTESIGVPIEIFKLEDRPTPEEWLSFFRDSEFIVTDSFHGTVFSIIFNKQFLVVDNKKRGSSRFNSLLSELGLSDRLISDDVMQANCMRDSAIDYSCVNKRLSVLKDFSYQYLKDNLRM